MQLNCISRIDSSVQESGNSIANIQELPQSCTKPLISIFILHQNIFQYDMTEIIVQHQSRLMGYVQKLGGLRELNSCTEMDRI